MILQVIRRQGKLQLWHASESDSSRDGLSHMAVFEYSQNKSNNGILPPFLDLFHDWLHFWLEFLMPWDSQWETGKDQRPQVHRPIHDHARLDSQHTLNAEGA